MRILATDARQHWLGHADCAVPEDADTVAAMAALIPQDALVLASGALDPHCDHLSVARLAQAVGAVRSDIALRMALSDQPQAEVIDGTAPADLPPLRPDLVLLSEVPYVLQPAKIDHLGQWLLDRVRGRVIAVNWTGPTDEPLDGPGAVARLSRTLGEGVTSAFHGFRIDVFGR